MIVYFRFILELICLREVLANIVNERTAASPFIPMAVFKLQLMCRKQNSIV
jgi:hypothetical protein